MQLPLYVFIFYRINRSVKVSAVTKNSNRK